MDSQAKQLPSRVTPRAYVKKLYKPTGKFWPTGEPIMKRSGSISFAIPAEHENRRARKFRENMARKAEKKAKTKERVRQHKNAIAAQKFSLERFGRGM